MSSGLLALLDDVAAITKVAAASLDDMAAHAGRAGAKAAGVIIDDAAVTPRYVVGFAPARELPIVGRIALGSVRNKLIFLLPAALLLSAFAPWAITPLLVLGGAYLCFEGTEKVAEWLFPREAIAPEEKPDPQPVDPKHLEDATVRGAIKTDFILSAEIMAISLSEMPEASVWTQAGVLAIVGLVITFLVYGVVAIIVKADDVGMALARRDSAPLRAIGRTLVRGMPILLKVLATIGTAAMIWVGGGIILHGLEAFGFAGLPHMVHDIAVGAGQAVLQAQGFVEWSVTALASGVLGLVVGAALIPIAGLFGAEH